jgi:hypothetical protein
MVNQLFISKIFACLFATWLLFIYYAPRSLAAYTTNRLYDWSNFSHTDKENGYETGIAEDVKYHGKSSAFVKSAELNQPTKVYFLTLWQTFKADKFRGKHIEFSGVVKSENVRGWMNPFVKVAQDDKVIRFDNRDDHRISHAKSWKKFSIEIDVPPKSTAIDIGFYTTGGGTFWLNDLDVKIVSDSRKVTNIPWDSKKFAPYSFEPGHLKNLDFTAAGSEESAQHPMGWASYENEKNYAWTVDRQMQFHGHPSACITCKTNVATDFALLYKDVIASDYTGHTKLSAFLKTKDVTDWSAIFMRVDGLDKVLSFDNMEDRPVKGTEDWKEYSIVLDVPKSAKKLRIGAMLAGTGTVWINSMKLINVSEDTPLTQKPRDLPNLLRDTMPDAPQLEFLLR